MHHTFRILVSISAVLVLSFPAVAQDTSGPKPAGTDQPASFPQNVHVTVGLTLLEQDAQKADLAMTARIRKGISVSKNLSMNARNVKVITTGGRVVLKGAVISAEEKRLIGEIAIGVQRKEFVDNQLVVSRPPSAPTGLRVVP